MNNNIIEKSIYVVDLGKYEGQKIGGKRPCLIWKQCRGTVIIIPITTDRGENLNEAEFYISRYGGLDYPSKLKLGQITTVCTSKVDKKIGELSSNIVENIAEKVFNYLL